MNEQQKIDMMAPDLQEPLALILEEVRRGLARRSEMWGHKVVLWDTWRDSAEQWSKWAKGRTRTSSGRWVVSEKKKVVTWARPEESPHCVTVDGRPASEAADIVIVTPTRWLENGHPGWALVPAAAYLVGGYDWEMGASFRSIRGGDWPHIQRRNWRGRNLDATLKT